MMKIVGAFLFKKVKKKHRGFNVDEIPDEVWRAYVIEHISKTVGIGSKLMSEYEEIKKKYPKYFKDEKETKT